MRLVTAYILAILLTVVAQHVAAGQTCSPQALTPEALRKALTLAVKTREQLDQSGANVVLIGRVGADLSEHGLRYSHVGFAWRDGSNDRWLVRHLLNHCGSTSSELFDEGLGNFFLDDPYAYEAVLVVPTPALQETLAATLASRLPAAFHTPEYSMIAYPYSTRYQNSNQWVLELAAASLAKPGLVNSRGSAQHWLREWGYTPSQIKISPLKRLGSRLFRANVRFDDHNARASGNGSYQIVSVESVIDFVTKTDGGAYRLVVALD